MKHLLSRHCSIIDSFHCSCLIFNSATIFFSKVYRDPLCSGAHSHRNLNLTVHIQKKKRGKKRKEKKKKRQFLILKKSLSLRKVVAKSQSRCEQGKLLSRTNSLKQNYSILIKSFGKQKSRADLL
jgi:hypothetical protein